MLDWLRYIVALGGAFAGATTAAGQEEALAVPSGNPVALQEWLLDEKPDGQFVYARFRFVMPAIGQGLTFDAVAGDFQALCDDYALPWLAGSGEAAERIVVSLADRETEFGVADRSATQFFEAFSFTADACIWEEF